LLFLFEDFVLDTGRRELRRGDASVAVEPQVFDLIVFLIHNRERVITKDDLLASVWGGRIVSESTLGTRMNAARAALGDSGGAQRLIRTLPRKGFRFVGEVLEKQALPLEGPSANSSAAAPPGPAAAIPPQRDRNSRRRRTAIAIGCVAMAAAALALILLLGGQPRAPGLGAVRAFDPTLVPLMDASDRLALADYAQKPEHKALAVSANGWGLAAAAPDVESAKTEALQRCGLRPQSACLLYAVDMGVVWPEGVVPVAAPGDQRTEPLAKFTLEEFATISKAWQQAAESYWALGSHRALAISRTRIYWVGQRNSQDDAIRLAVERCGYQGQLPCLLLSVDGFWTVEIPTSRPISTVFLPGTEAELPVAERRRIAAVYRGSPWRAVARGRNGTWHAVAGAASETAAVEASLEACNRADVECRLFAIGNFRVADDK
jgi:DNA-binding winged helix-turn-helix (wHTH) protein